MGNYFQKEILSTAIIQLQNLPLVEKIVKITKSFYIKGINIINSVF